MVLLLGVLAFARGVSAQGEAPLGQQLQADVVSEYKRHLDAGVKLFQQGDYPGAITEFQAAYVARNELSPLINISLSHKAQHDYLRAVAVLERALARHVVTMTPEDEAAIRKEIRELKSLLAYVTVKVDPAGAALYVDGEQQPAENVGQPIPLSPGPHKLEAKLSGYADATMTITVTAGQKQQLAFQLDARGDADAESTGQHRTGLYGFVGAAVLGTTSTALEFKPEGGQAGGAFSLRAGYRLHDAFGAELGLQYTQFGFTGEIPDPATGQPLADAGQTLRALFIGPMARLMLPPRGTYRFVATLGGGLAHSESEWSNLGPDEARFVELGYKSTEGMGGFFALDLGLEIEFQKVLIDLVLQIAAQSTGGLEDAYDGAIVLVGPALRGGYGFW